MPQWEAQRSLRIDGCSFSFLSKCPFGGKTVEITLILMIKKTKAILVASAFSLASPAFAGESTFIATADRPSGNLPGGAYLTVEGGVWSDFIFRGRELGGTSGDARAELIFPLGDSASLSLGGRYVGGDDYEQSEGFAAVQQGFGAVTLAAGYRFLGMDAEDRHELGLMLAMELGGLDWMLAFFHDTEFSGEYIELAARKSWTLSEPVSLGLGGGISFASDYWVPGSGFNHAFLRLEIPVAVREGVKLTPWIAGNFPVDQLDDIQSNEVYGGVNLRLDF